MVVGVAGAASARGVVPPMPQAPVFTTTWSSALQQAIPVSGWSGQTLRMVVRASAGGSAARIRLGDPFSGQPAVIGHASIAQQLNQGAAVGVPTDVTFGGAVGVTLNPGATVESDEVPFSVAAGTRLLVSLYLSPGQDITSAPVHNLALETEYNYVGADVVDASAPTMTNSFGFVAYLEAIEVTAPRAATVAVVGDSITDGQGTALDTDTRWTDYLAARAAGIGIANVGISTDEVTTDQPGVPSIETRWASDVAGQVGVRTVVDEGGINDLRDGEPAAALESVQASLVASAHAAGLRIVLTTLTPCAGASLCDATFEAARQAYNLWVRTGGSGADGYADFDAAIGNGAAIATAYDCGDHIHPDPAGEQLLAAAVNVSSL
jgi:lysophospholipase L1-like esterase